MYRSKSKKNSQALFNFNERACRWQDRNGAGWMSHNSDNAGISVKCKEQVPLWLLRVDESGAVHKEHEQWLQACMQVLQKACIFESPPKASSVLALFKREEHL